MTMSCDPFPMPSASLVAGMAGAFWYVASPISRYPTSLAAAQAVAPTVAMLAKAGVPLYCPALETALLADLLPDFSHADWMEFDKPKMEAATGCLVVGLDGWRESKGVAIEIDYFRRLPRMVFLVDPV